MSADRDRSFDAAAERMCVSFRDDRGRNLDPDDFSSVVTGLSKIVRARYPMIDADELKDIVANTIVKFYERVRSGAIECERAPAYLIKVALNEARDHLRKQKLVVATAEVEDDRVILEFFSDQILVAIDDELAVLRALQLAKENGDHMCIRVVTRWLELARALGRAPTSRELGAELKVSHTTVLTNLRRFASYFPEEPVRE